MVEEKFEFADKAEKAFDYLEKTFPDPNEMQLFTELIIVNSTTFGRKLMKDRSELNEKEKKK